MKKIYTTIFAIGIGLSSLVSAQINTFPYQEDFEANDGAWVASGTATWEHGAPSNIIINNGAGCTGPSNAWVTGLATSYPNSAMAYLESPVFDMSGLSADPIIYFERIFDNETCCDESWMEMSIDGGTTWTKVGTQGTGLNWYEDAGNQWWDASISMWTISYNTLTGAAGNADVRVRFVFSSDGSVSNEGVGVDNIYIGDGNFADLQITEVISPATGMGLTASEPIIVVVTNNGFATVSFADYSICYNGDIPQACETTITSILPGATDTLTLLGTVDASTPGIYNTNFNVSTTTPDMNVCNDTISYSFTHIPVISNYPSLENFEANNGNWTAGGTMPGFEYGAPAGAVINSTNGCGVNVWMTGLSTSYANSANTWVMSPYYDLTGFMADPFVVFDYNYDNEQCCDETWMEYTTDGGTTWLKLGTQGTGMNWYNDGGNQWWDAPTNGWVKALQPLTGLAGQIVAFRFVMTSDGSVSEDGFAFDNFFVGASYEDATLGNMSAPMSGCGLTAAETISVDIINNGSGDITSIDVCYSVNGGAAVCETVSTTIVPGVPYTHTFTQTADLSVVGDYTIDFEVMLANDMDSCNNQSTGTVSNVLQVVNYPYIENFESGQNGWVIDNTINGSWEFGTPAGSVINSAASGNNAFVTSLAGTYNSNENSWVMGPCFDFTNLCAPQIEMDIWYESETSWDGSNLQFSVDGGTTWTNVGLLADPFNYNWYNDGSIDGNPGGSQEGWSAAYGNGSNGWVTARHALDTLGGYPDVKLRITFGSDGSVSEDGFAFDNVKVYDGVYRDNRTVLICPGDSAMLIGLGYGNTADTWLWSTGETNDTIYVTTPGTYTYDLVTGGCAFVDSLEAVTLDTTAMAVLPLDSAYCGSVVLGDSTLPNTDYMWNTGAMTSMITADTSGLYILTASNVCATKSDSVNVTINSLPTVNLGADTTLCVTHLPFTLDAGAGFAGYVWSDASTGQTLSVSATTTTYTVIATDTNGCEATDMITVTIDPCTGVEELTMGQINFYPNPTTGLVTVEFADNVAANTELLVLDLNGKVVYSTNITATRTILDLSNVANGVYNVLIQSENATSNAKLVITK